MGAMASAPSVRATTWNVAAVNNNPFEYWITHPDAEYAALMGAVEAFIDAPAERDLPVREVLTSEMVARLVEAMRARGWVGVEETAAAWDADFSQRRIISGFLKDKTLGSKRLASMPDRVTNTIGLADGTTACRPAVINMYEGPLDSIDQWFTAWLAFMFEDELELKAKDGSVESKKGACELLGPIRRAKYPDVTEEEERISLPLQTLCQAIFDAVLVHVLNTVAPGKWHTFKLQLCEALAKKKTQRTISILSSEHCASSDVIALQEVSGAMFDAISASPLADSYHVLAPASFSRKRDQNSIVLARKALFSEPEDASGAIEATFADKGEKCPSDAGDLAAFKVKYGDSGAAWLLASFHGDTNGLMTWPVTEAVAQYANAHHTALLFGLDANTYNKPVAGKQYGCEDYGAALGGVNMTSCWGDTPSPTNFTTYIARTYLQPQLNKAVKASEKATSKNTDRNPKDFIVFFKGSFEVESTAKDNTGKGTFEGDSLLPTLDFPSDHAACTAVLTVL